MLNLASCPLPRPDITPNGPLEDLHHESKKVPRQCCIPPPLARLIPDERMLRLHLEELRDYLSSKYYLRIFSTHRTSHICVLQCLTDQVSPRTGNMRILLAEDHLLGFDITLNVSCRPLLADLQPARLCLGH